MLETYKNPDIPNHFAMVEVKEGELFGKVDCVDQTYQQGLYYDGMPCLNVSFFKNQNLDNKNGTTVFP